jgi:hypothetical protein
MNKVSIKPLGETEATLAIFFEKEDRHEMAFLLEKGSRSVSVCETILIDDVPLINPMMSLPLKWLEGAIQEGLSHHSESFDMGTPLGNKFSFTKDDFKKLQDYLNAVKGGSNG